MKRILILLRLLLAVTLLFQSVLSIQAQNTGGTEFWVTFGQNLFASYLNNDLQIRIVAKENQVTGKIYFTNLGTFKDFDIPAKQVYTYSLSELWLRLSRKGKISIGSQKFKDITKAGELTWKCKELCRDISFFWDDVILTLNEAGNLLTVRSYGGGYTLSKVKE